MDETTGGQKIAGYIGQAAFFVGFILAIIGGIWWRDSGGFTLALIILGIIVSLLNITAKEVVIVLVAAIALIVTSTGEPFKALNDIIGSLGTGLDGIVSYLAVFMVPVAVISAVRAVIAVGRRGD